MQGLHALKHEPRVAYGFLLKRSLPRFSLTKSNPSICPERFLTNWTVPMSPMNLSIWGRNSMFALSE